MVGFALSALIRLVGWLGGVGRWVSRRTSSLQCAISPKVFLKCCVLFCHMPLKPSLLFVKFLLIIVDLFNFVLFSIMKISLWVDNIIL